MKYYIMGEPKKKGLKSLLDFVVPVIVVLFLVFCKYMGW